MAFVYGDLTTWSAYCPSRPQDGAFVFDLDQTWEKIMLAARAIVAIPNPKDIAVVSTRDFGRRPVLKFCHYVGASPLPERYMAGLLTNYTVRGYLEPSILIVTDPLHDHQPLQEAAQNGIPIIALCDTSTSTDMVDVVIPCNNRGKYSIGLVYWLLAAEVLRIRGQIPRTKPWSVMPDMFFHMDPKEYELAAAQQELTQRSAAEREAVAAIQAPDPVPQRDPMQTEPAETEAGPA